MTKIVQSLLALAVSSSVALAQGGWSGAPGKGLSYDGGDAFSFKMANQLQTHYVYGWNESTATDAGTDTNGFRVRRARTTFSGTAFSKDIHYVLTVDATDDETETGAPSNGSIKDGHVTWNFLSNENSTLGLRMGQGKTQFGFEGTGSSKGLFFAERSNAARTFSDARSTGLWLTGAYMENSLRWALGAMNGGAVGAASLGEQAANDDDELSYVLAANWDPMGDITGGKGGESWRQGDFREGDRGLAGTVGAAISIENAGSATTADAENTTYNINTAWSIEGFQVLAEYFNWTSDVTGAAGSDPDADGFNLAGTYVLPKGADSAIQWGFGARISTVDLTTAGVPGGDETTDISLVANAFYHGHACKTQLEVTQRDADNADTSDLIFTVAFQLLF